MKTGFFLICFFAMAYQSMSQNIAGKWKLVEGYVEYYGGSKDDFVTPMYKETPCLEKSLFVFSNDGNISLQNWQNCVPDGKNAANVGTKWKFADGGKKLLVYVSGDDMEPTDFILTIDKNSMIWHVDYPYEGGDKKTSPKKIFYRFTKQP